MKTIALNAFNGISGISLSIVESTPIPVVIYACLLLATEIYKYKNRKLKDKE